MWIGLSRKRVRGEVEVKVEVKVKVKVEVEVEGGDCLFVKNPEIARSVPARCCSGLLCPKYMRKTKE